jgi:chorismate synthase
VTRLDGGYEIRPFRTIEDFEECVALQEATWGEGFSERVPAAILMVSQRLGGVAAGAYDSSGLLVGFVFGMTGVDEQGLVHWSDMLAVRKSVRDTGLGRSLKAYQRRILLERDVRRMIWTFDPLQSRNAYLNFRRLGAVAREYVRDMYGQTDSPLHQGIGTDRLLALWELDSDRVTRRLAGDEAPVAPSLSGARVALGYEMPAGAGLPRPGRPDAGPAEPVVSVAIPADLDELKRRDLSLALAWRQATRHVIETYLERGYEARELVRDGPVSHYLFVTRAPDAD